MLICTEKQTSQRFQKRKYSLKDNTEKTKQEKKIFEKD